MHDFLRHRGDPSQEPRRLMPPEVAEGILAAADTIQLADPAHMNNLVQRMGDPTRMDGWQATKDLTDSLGTAHDLYWGDLGLLRVCLGNEHATAVFDGNEIDYAPLFGDNDEALKVSRLTALLQDSGKVLSVAETGENFAQSFYNVLIARKIVGSIADEHLSPVGKQAVVALVGLDVIGGMLQGHDTDEKLAEFLAAWPHELDEFREDLMLSSYLSDASAHSSYRLYRNARNGFPEPAVRDEDAQLSFLFERHPGGAVTLTSDRRELLLARLPEVNRMRYLLTGEQGPYTREDEAFAEIVSRRTSGTPTGRQTVSRQGAIGQEVYVLERQGRFGVSLNAITYPRGHPDIAMDNRYWLPGDGRLWRRSVWAGNTPLAFEDYGPPPSEYAHPDPDVAAMQKRVAEADRVYSSNIGQPVSAEEAWRIISEIENLPSDTLGGAASSS